MLHLEKLKKKFKDKFTIAYENIYNGMSIKHISKKYGIPKSFVRECVELFRPQMIPPQDKKYQRLNSFLTNEMHSAHEQDYGWKTHNYQNKEANNLKEYPRYSPTN